MKKNHTHLILRPVAAVLTTVIVLFGCASVAYAADVGGIRTTVQSWFRGKEAAVDVVEKKPGLYEFKIHQDGETYSMGGGGVEHDIFGNEKPMSAENVVKSLSERILLNEDGSIWLYYENHAIDITEYMTEDGCKLLLNNNGEKLYYDIEPSDEYGNFNYSYRINKPHWGVDPDDYIPIN